MKIRKYIISLLFIAISATATAQYTNTLYFMDEISERNAMNPAFLPRCQSYFDLILLPNFYAGASENMFTLRDLNNIEALTQRLLNSGIEKRETSNVHINFVNFGIALGLDQYFIFESGINIDEMVVTPTDMFRLALEGMPDPNGTYNYNLKDLEVDLNAFAYLGMGYSGRLSEHATFGIKAKALFGMANAKSSIQNLELQTSRENWTLYSQSTVNVATCLPLEYQLNEFGKVDFKTMKLGSWTQFKPAGYGASLDLGMTIEPIKNLVISASVTDLGIIHWNKSSMNQMSLNTNVVYNGAIHYALTDTNSILKKAEETLKGLGDQITDSISIAGNTGAYNSMIYAKFFAGIEYGILENKISFGLMNRMTFNNKRLYDELTFAVNFRPCQWFKAALSYSMLNNSWGSLGLGLNLNLGPVVMYLIADYVPLTWTEVTSEAKNIKAPVPDWIRDFNLQAGMAFNLDRFDRDNDRDGVPNKYDICPDESIEYLRKQHPKVKLHRFTDANGCIADKDNDEVLDFMDKCPDVPGDAKNNGCPKEETIKETVEETVE